MAFFCNKIVLMSLTLEKELASTSLSAYQGCLKRLNAVLSNADFIESPKEVIEEVKSMYPNLSTQKVYISALMHFVKSKNIDTWNIYKQYFDKIRPTIDRQATSQSLNRSAQTLYVSWDILKEAENLAIKKYKADELSLSDTLIVLLYTEQAPVRADYGQMEFIGDSRNAKNPNVNYCLLRATKPIFIFQAYKTARSYGRVEIPIKRKVYDLLIERYEEMREKGSNLVFTENQPNFSARVKKVFNELIGKAIGISLIRHSYITNFLKKNPSIHLKQEVAKNMLNSVAVQEAYRVLDENVIAEDGE